MARRLGIDGEAVAAAVMTNLLNEDAVAICIDNNDLIGITEHLLDAADIDYQPRARKLILTFDLSDPEPTPMLAQGGPISAGRDYVVGDSGEGEEDPQS